MQQIYNYLNQQNVPEELSGYDHLANIICFANKNNASIAHAIEKEANRVGLSVAQLRGRLRYAISLSKNNNTQVTKFIRLAIRKFPHQENNSQ